MRHLVLAVLTITACGQPGESHLSEIDPGWEADELAVAPPPPIALGLTVSALAPGAVADIEVTNALPGESTLRVLRSDVGIGWGPCHPIIDNGCTDLLSPSAMGPYTADNTGTLTLAPTLPGTLPPGLEVCLQAFAPRGNGGVDSVKSATVCRVLGQPVEVGGGANLGEEYSDGSSSGGGLVAFRLDVPNNNATVGYAQVFAGEVSGTAQISIWSHDTANNEPDSMLTGWSSWDNTHDPQWQGAQLTDDVVMGAGEVYWVVYEPVVDSQFPQQDTGTSVTYRGSWDGGSTWTGPYAGALKFRVCGRGGC